MIHGRRRELGLGSADLVGLADARAQAIANQAKARSGGDPLAERCRERAMPTFAEATEEAHKELSFTNPKDDKAFLTNLRTYAFPRFGQMRVCDVTGPDIRAAVMAIRDEKPEVPRKLIKSGLSRDAAVAEVAMIVSEKAKIKAGRSLKEETVLKAYKEYKHKLGQVLLQIITLQFQ